MDFPEVLAAARVLADRIRTEAPKFDALVGIARGGWVPTLILSSLLSVERIYNIGLEYADTTRKTFTSYQDPALSLQNSQTLLIVEDYLVAGNALRHAKEHLESKGHSVYTVALFVMDKTTFVPDFYLERLQSLPSLPWELPH